MQWVTKPRECIATPFRSFPKLSRMFQIPSRTPTKYFPFILEAFYYTLLGP